MVSMNSAGRNESRKTTVPASSGGIKIPSIWPNTWLRGSRFKKRSGWKILS
jgi:hypothetical protein